MRKKSLTSSKWFAGWHKQFILSSRRGKGETEIDSNFCLHCLVIALPPTKGNLKTISVFRRGLHGLAFSLDRDWVIAPFVSFDWS